MKVPALIVALVAAVSVAVIAGHHGRKAAADTGCSSDPSGLNVTCNDAPYNCAGPVALQSVTVNIVNVPDDAVHLQAGCTGSIGSITVTQYHGDGIKVGAFAHDITVGTVTIRCYGLDAGKHQDGIQVMGGQHIHFGSVNAAASSVGCYSANDSQILIHEGAANQEEPFDVTFTNFSVDPQGTGAYVVSNGLSDRSGFTHLTLLSDGNLHDLWQGDGTTNAIWQCDSVPAGTRANFDTTGTGCTG